MGGPVTHEATVTLTINDHREEIKLHCITIGNSPIIVGLPWLRKHNPNINWKEGRITFDSEKCGKTCLAASPHATMITEKRVEAEYERSTGRSWEKVYAIMIGLMRKQKGKTRNWPNKRRRTIITKNRIKKRKGSESRRRGKNMWRMRKKSNKAEGARIIPMNRGRLNTRDPPRMKTTPRDPHCGKPRKRRMSPRKQPHQKTQNDHKRF
jgi:hypothetical protein